MTIKAIIQGIESIRKGVTLKIDIDDAKRPKDIATWQDEEVTITNGKDIVEGEVWKIQTLSDQTTRLSVDIPRDTYPHDIFTWKHEQILIKKEKDNGNSAETGSQKGSTSKKGKRKSE